MPSTVKAPLKIRACEKSNVEFKSDSDRFCRKCSKLICEQLDAAGYPTKVPWRNPYHSTNNFDPHLDEQNPVFENSVRAAEDN